MVKFQLAAVAGLGLMALAGCSRQDRTADNLPRPILNSERMNSELTTTTDASVGSTVTPDVASNSDATSLSTTQATAVRASPSPSPSMSPHATSGAGGAGGASGTAGGAKGSPKSDGKISEGGTPASQ